MILERKKPEDAGMLSERLERADLVIEDAIEQKVMPSAVALVTRSGKIVFHRAYGYLDPEEGRHAELDSIYDLASVTKPMSAGVSLVALVEDGRLHLEQEARGFFPERKLPHWSGITLRHLLTHTSGISSWKAMYLKGEGRAEILDTLFSLEMQNPPGKNHVYSCLGYITLCFIIERVTGMGLDQYVKERIHRPLELSTTMFNPPAELYPRIAATGHCPLRKNKLVGQVHDGNAFGMGGVSGNAGLFSTAEEVATFWNMLIFRGAFNGKRILSPLATDIMRTRQIDPSIGGQTIGCFTMPNMMLAKGDLLPAECFGHTGYTGNTVVADPVHEVVSVMLTNRALWDDQPSDRFFVMRRCFQNAVASAIIE